VLIERKSIWVLLFLMGLGLGWQLPALLASDSRAATRRQPRLLPVETMMLDALSSYRTARAYTGQVTARRSSDLGFERSGKLVAIAVDEGAKIPQGTPLATLDTQALLTTQQQLQAQRAQAAAQLAELLAGPRRETIAAAQAQLHEQRAELALAEQRRQRREHLWSKGLASREEFDAADADFKAWTARLNAAQRRLDALLSGTRPEQITAQQALVVQYEAQLAAVALDLQKSVLKAPFAGTIAVRLADEGTVVSEGQSILRLIEDTHLEVRVGVPPNVAATLSVGEEHQLQIGDEHHRAHLTALLPELDTATRTVIAVFTLPSPPAPGVIAGQVARLSLHETVPTAGFWLPMTALARGERGLWSCYALVPVSDDPALGFRAEQRSVEVLHTDNSQVFVRGLLQSGEQVIKNGIHRIVAGQHVQPIS
jgi:multidrug efflux pump subunit AcrA (membrane-fusion protein)